MRIGPTGEERNTRSRIRHPAREKKKRGTDAPTAAPFAANLGPKTESRRVRDGHTEATPGKKKGGEKERKGKGSGSFSTMQGMRANDAHVIEGDPGERERKEEESRTSKSPLSTRFRLENTLKLPPQKKI